MELIEITYRTPRRRIIREWDGLDYDSISEIAAYGGFPVRFPHWSWEVADKVKPFVVKPNVESR